MKPVAFKSPTGAKTLLSFVFGLTFMTTWLPFLRSLSDGSSYVWGTTWFGQAIAGSGVDASFTFLAIQMAFYIALFFSLYWIANRKVFYTLAVLWFCNTFGSMYVDILLNGDLMFHGDTMGVHISINWIVYALGLASLGLIVVVIRQDMAGENVTLEWSHTNSLLAWGLLALLPVQVILLASGEPDGLTDKTGVMFSIAECLALPFLLRPFSAKAPLASAPAFQAVRS